MGFHSLTTTTHPSNVNLPSSGHQVTARLSARRISVAGGGGTGPKTPGQGHYNTTSVSNVQFIHHEQIAYKYYPRRSISTYTLDSCSEFSYFEGRPGHPPTWLKFRVVLFSRDTASTGSQPLSFVFFPIYHLWSTRVSDSCETHTTAYTTFLFFSDIKYR